MNAAQKVVDQSQQVAKSAKQLMNNKKNNLPKQVLVMVKLWARLSSELNKLLGKQPKFKKVTLNFRIELLAFLTLRPGQSGGERSMLLLSSDTRC